MQDRYQQPRVRYFLTIQRCMLTQTAVQIPQEQTSELKQDFFKTLEKAFLELNSKDQARAGRELEGIIELINISLNGTQIQASEEETVLSRCKTLQYQQAIDFNSLFKLKATLAQNTSNDEERESEQTDEKTARHLKQEQSEGPSRQAAYFGLDPPVPIGT